VHHGFNRLEAPASYRNSVVDARPRFDCIIEYVPAPFGILPVLASRLLSIAIAENHFVSIPPPVPVPSGDHSGTF
jgi:hypothetical protein